ncbi:MAG TPA: hypothetical protein VJL29_02040, partial [Thermoguttaceae bacterium]|nr:hypothetical protein [Thermoguttaceae bacterium]
AMQAVTQEQLDRWGVSFYEAMETARANLAEMQHAFIGPEEGEGVYLSATGDNYDASRLLLLDTVGRMRLKGRPVAIAANRDSLIVAGDDDLEALRGMVALAGEALQKPRAVSGVALRLDGDEWGPWLPEASHPLYGEFRSLFIQSIGQAYAEQKTLLDQLHARTGEDVVVPSFSAMRNPATGGVLTFCIWGEHCTSLLPCTDLVAFVGVGRDPVMAPWGRVVETLGHLMRPEGIYPERYRVVDFPTREQLAAMENVMP